MFLSAKPKITGGHMIATSAAVAALWNTTCAVKWKLTSGKHLDVPAEQLPAQLSLFYFNMEMCQLQFHYCH